MKFGDKVRTPDGETAVIISTDEDTLTCNVTKEGGKTGIFFESELEPLYDFYASYGITSSSLNTGNFIISTDDFKTNKFEIMADVGPALFYVGTDKVLYHLDRGDVVLPDKERYILSALSCYVEETQALEDK